jgi:predicted flap endonuclease-1-like 5' DNA nuclease
MPELTVTHFALLGGALVVGVVIGWLVRADRCAKEKIAVNASWQDQLESQQSEHGRLAEQNKSLMEQVSQYQASHKDHTNRAKELSDSLKEAFARRDEMQRQLKDMRGKLEIAVAQRNSAREELQRQPQGQSAAMKEKDDKIFNLSRELTSWQSRVPPLVERFQERDKEARELAEALDRAEARIAALEELTRSDNTRIEPVDADALPDGGDASNEPVALTASHDTTELQDQIDNDVEEIDDLEDFVEPVEEDIEPVASDEEFDDVFAEDSEPEPEPEPEPESEPEREPDIAAGDVIDIAAAAADAPQGDDPSGGAVDDVAYDEGTATFAGNGAAAPAPISDDEEKDDLQLIKGIGPSIEKTLNELGVYRFHQIAEMSEYEIDRVAQQLKGFRSRIYREDWIGQARDLQYQKSNSRS